MKISLIIAVFNGDRYLRSAIESFLDQDYADKELIIIDGKSTDTSHQIIDQYQLQNPDLIFWIKEKDSGISEARNIALRHIKGDIVGFLGADDILHKNFFNEMAYYARINPHFDVMYFDGYVISKSSSHFRRSADINFTVRNLIKHCPISSGECFYYKKHVFERFSFNDKNRYCMDYELNMALLTSKDHKYSFYGVAIPAVFNTSDGNNVSSFLSIKQRAETAVVQLKYANNWFKKLKIILRRPKFILKNWQEIIKTIKHLS